MTPDFNPSYSQGLIQAGLTEEQARIYEILLKKGARRAGQLPTLAGISRTYVYKQLDELIGLGLVTRHDPPGQPARFSAAHPFAVEELIQRRQLEVQTAKKTVDGLMSSLVSDYTSSSRIPGVRILRDIEGIAELQDDICGEKQNVRLIRSTLDSVEPDMLKRNLDHSKKAAALGIHTRLIGPQPDHANGSTLAALDASRLTERRILSQDDLHLPANMLIYGNKVALTSYEEPSITTVIENDAIATTMGAIFELVWETSKLPD
jgi:sugar-specific transcriptional regulator TrmB